MLDQASHVCTEGSCQLSNDSLEAIMTHWKEEKHQRLINCVTCLLSVHYTVCLYLFSTSIRFLPEITPYFLLLDLWLLRGAH